MLATTLTTILRRQGAVEAPYVFSPSELFASGEEGCWYDPSDFTTLYADTAGTTAITAVEQPVGLMLDKSQGLVLGSELVTNGTFDTNTTGWTVLGTATFVSTGGQGVLTVSSGSFFAGQAVTVTSGKWYEVRASFISKTAASSAFFRAGTSAIGGTEYFTVSPTVDGTSLIYRVLATTSTMYVAVGVNASGYSSTWDNISVRELPGNHARAANGSTARPVLRNRYQLLTYSQELDNAVWRKLDNSGSGLAAVVTANAGVAPDGTTTADRLVLDLDGGTSTGDISVCNWYAASGLPAGSVKTSIWVKSYDGSSSYTVGFYNASGTDTPVTIDGNWQRLVVSGTSTGSGYCGFRLRGGLSPARSNSVDLLVWGAQLTTADDHDAINGEYQRIAAAPTVGAAPTYDDDATKFPPYLYATTDDAMSTASIDFSSGDEMSVFAGVTKESDAAAGNLIELAALAGSNGKFTLFAPGSAGANYFWRSRGTLDASSLTAGSYPAPITSVLTGIGDIGDDICKLRYNATEILNLTTDQGTGNYGNYPLYLFARGGSSNFYTGRLYSLIVRNALTSGDELANTESYVAQKTGVTL